MIGSTLLSAVVALSPMAQAAWPTRSGFDIVRFADSCEFDGYWPVAGRSEINLTLSIGVDGRSIMMVSSSDWTNRPDEEFELSIFVADRAYRASAVGLPRSAYRNGFSVLVHEDFLDGFAEGSDLMITRDEAVVAHLGLRQTANGVADLRACARYVSRQNAAQAEREARVDYIARDPFAEPGEPLTPTPAGAPAEPTAATNLSWANEPRPVMPDRARERGLTGSAVLSCTVNANGSLSGCSIAAETPAGAGFGRAALAAVRSARLSPRSVDGVAPGGTVRFTVPFAQP